MSSAADAVIAPDAVLDALEAEAIHIFREAAGAFRRPVLLYSIGKDSSVLLHLAVKAFAPGKVPFPVLHIDTTWKFREMIEFRDRAPRELGLDLLVHTNEEGVQEGVTPFTHGTHEYTRIMKTVALRQALDAGRLRRRDRWRPPRRGALAGQGAGLLAARARPPLGAAQAAPGVLAHGQHPARPRARRCGCSRCRTGPSSTCGATSSARTSRSYRCTSPSTARSSTAAAS